MNRRRFLQVAAGSAAWAATAPRARSQENNVQANEEVSAAHLPRWRGFNLLEKFTAPGKPFVESDFQWIHDWGFNFVRLPLSYRCWADVDDWLTLKEAPLKEIDQAVAYGQQYGVRVNLNFHRAPGYCVNPPKEPLDLWTDDQALDAAAFHWAAFSKRYKGIPNRQVIFDLLNEPGDIPTAQYVKVVRRLAEAIRGKDPDRLIIADGLKWGNQPVPELADLKIGQSTRGYAPMQISHYKASWVNGSDKWPEPTWPLHLGDNDVWDKERLRREHIAPWQALQAKGVGVHVGEWGAFQYTPHAVVLAWMADQLALWKEAGWGWSMWNLRGGFGPVDSNRADVTYEDFHGHKLDRQMLELLQAN